jgi:hypothetical protein
MGMLQLVDLHNTGEGIREELLQALSIPKARWPSRMDMSFDQGIDLAISSSVEVFVQVLGRDYSAALFESGKVNWDRLVFVMSAPGTWIPHSPDHGHSGKLVQ